MVSCIRGGREEVSEIACELGNGEQLQTLEIEAGVGILVAELHLEGNVDAASNRKHASVRCVTKEITGEPGAGSGFAAIGL
jgi:hypothetical protein